MSDINLNDLPAFPPPGFTKEQALSLLEFIEKSKKESLCQNHNQL